MNDQREPLGFLRASSWPLLLFGGNGGVGKATAAAATAQDIASRHPDRAIPAPTPAAADCCWWGW